jgi:hypothetical protein
MTICSFVKCIILQGLDNLVECSAWLRFVDMHH